MKKGKIIIVVISIALLILGCTQKARDKFSSLLSESLDQKIAVMEYYTEDDFSVAFPGVPEQTPHENELDGIIYMVDHGEKAYLVSIVNIPGLEDIDPDGIQTIMNESMIASLGGLELEKREDIISNTHPGVHFSGQGESEGSQVIQYSKIFLTETKLIQALGIGVDAKSSESLKEFVESFQLGNFQ